MVDKVDDIEMVEQMAKIITYGMHSRLLRQPNMKFTNYMYEIMWKYGNFD